MDGVRRGRAIALACGLASAGVARAGGAAERHVVGTIRATGQVESSVEPGRWRPLTGGAVVEAMSIRTVGVDSAAVLELPGGDMVALASDTTCEVMPGSPLRVRLEVGRLAYRLRADSATEIATAHAMLRTPLAGGTSTGPLREGLVTCCTPGAAQITVAQSYRGTSEVVALDGQAHAINAGQIVTLAPDEKGGQTVRVAAATPGSPLAAETKSAKKSGAFDWFSSIFGLSGAASGAILGGPTTDASGGGGGDSDPDSGAAGDGGGEASPLHGSQP